MASLGEMMQYADYYNKVNDQGAGGVNAALGGFMAGMKDGKSKRALSNIGVSSAFDDVNKEHLDAAYKFVEMRDKLQTIAQREQGAQMMAHILQLKAAQTEQGQAQAHSSLGTTPTKTDKTESSKLSSVMDEYIKNSDLRVSGDMKGNFRYELTPHKPKQLNAAASLSAERLKMALTKAVQLRAREIATQKLIDSDPETYRDIIKGKKPLPGEKEVKAAMKQAMEEYRADPAILNTKYYQEDDGYDKVLNDFNFGD